MKPLEIVCESCESHMRLSVSLLEKISGKSGRVTCRECGSKIMLDATLETVRITKGGRAANALELKEIEDFTEAPPSVDPHLSEFPLEGSRVAAQHGRSLPPPVPREARARSRQAKAQMDSGVGLALQYSRDSKAFEAPAPHLGSEGSLTPLALDDEDDLVPLGREFNSSPFSSERDQSYNSLFPKPERKPAPAMMDAPAPIISKAPSPPKRGELRRMKSEPDLFKDEISTAPAIAATVVEMGSDGQLINQTDKKGQKAHSMRASHWVPWTVAAIALLGLGVSVSLGRRPNPVVIQAPDAVLQPSAAAATQANSTHSEEPSAAVVESEQEISAVEKTTPAAALAPDAAETAGTTVETSSGVAAATSSLQTEKLGAARTSLKASTETPAPAVEKSSAEEAEAEEPAEEPVLAPFSSAAAATAMREATALAGACRKAGDPTGYAKVVLTFAPSGRVTRASVTGAPFAGTETGGCIASRFRTARVPAFAGEHVTVTKTVTIR